MRPEHHRWRVQGRDAGGTCIPAATSCSAPRPVAAARCWKRSGPIPVYNSVREPGCRPPLQLRRRLPAAVGCARRCCRADPGQPGTQQDLHRHGKAVGSRQPARSGRWASRTASTSSAATAWASPMPGTRSASGCWAATARPRRAQGLDRHSVQLRQLHHHDRDVPADGGLGHDHGDLQRQGHLHPLRGTGVRLRPGQRRPQQGRRAVCRTGRPL